MLRIVCLSTGVTRRIKSRLDIYSYAYGRSSPSRRRVGWWRNILCSNDANPIIVMFLVVIRVSGPYPEGVYIPLGGGKF